MKPQKLNGENYVNWKFKLMTVLESFNAWSIVCGDEPNPTSPALVPEWNKRETKAKVTLWMIVKDNVIPHIRNCETSKVTWDMLRSLYETRDANRVLFLKSKLLSINMETNEGVSKFISHIKDLSDKLGDIGEIVDNTDLVTITLKGLVPDYKVFILALSATKIPPIFLELTGILIQEEERMKNYDLYAQGSDFALMARGRYAHRGKPWNRDKGKPWKVDIGKFHVTHTSMAQNDPI